MIDVMTKIFFHTSWTCYYTIYIYTWFYLHIIDVTQSCSVNVPIPPKSYKVCFLRFLLIVSMVLSISFLGSLTLLDDSGFSLCTTANIFLSFNSSSLSSAP